MKKIEEFNFTRPIYNFLKQNNINTIEDIKKIDYELVKNNKDVYNAIVSRLHTEKILFDFEIPFYTIIKRRIANNENIKIEELTISAHTKTALNKLGVNYINELFYLDMNSLKQLRNNELGEVLYMMEMFNICPSEKYNDRLVILNQKLDELILSDKAIFELKALGCITISDYIHKFNNIIGYLSDSTKKEIDSKVNEFMVSDKQPIEITIQNLESENEILADSNDKRRKKLLRLEFLKSERERLLKETAKIDAEFNKLIK